MTILESLLAVEDLRRLSLSLAGVAALLVEGAIASFSVGRWVDREKLQGEWSGDDWWKGDCFDVKGINDEECV